MDYRAEELAGSKHNIIPEYYSADIVEFKIGDIARVYNKNGQVIVIYKRIIKKRL